VRTRKHHNNKGERQIRRGKTEDQVRVIAKRLGLKYKIKSELWDALECGLFSANEIDIMASALARATKDKKDKE
jgi:hypothetical protein